MFPTIEQLQELLKSYYIALRYDAEKAARLLKTINELRLTIALDAELREIYYSQLDVPALATGYQQTLWFSKNDIEYNIVRGIAYLVAGAQLSAVNQGNNQRILTREPIAWQQMFSAWQGFSLGQDKTFDLPQPIEFSENEAFGIGITGNTSAGLITFHGCTYKDSIEEVRRERLENEINNYLPQPQLVPLIFQFTAALTGNQAVSPTGADEIYSAKYERSVLLTHISTTAPNSRITLIDEGRNQMICHRVEARGVAATSTNALTTYYPLPYPHLLRKGDRIRFEALNGCVITGDVEAPNVLEYVNFLGYSI